MNVEEYIKAGQLDEALAFAQEAVRKTPAEARPRILLFQLLSVLGQWERALTQLNVLRDMDPECMVLAEIFRPVLQCEALREEIFAGKRSPLIFGEPMEWIGRWCRPMRCWRRGRRPRRSNCATKLSKLLRRQRASSMINLLSGSRMLIRVSDRWSKRSSTGNIIGSRSFGSAPSPPRHPRIYVILSGPRRSLSGRMAAKHRGLFRHVIPARRRQPTTHFGSRARRNGMISGNELFFGVGHACSPPIKQKPPLTEVRRIELTQS